VPAEGEIESTGRKTALAAMPLNVRRFLRGLGAFQSLAQGSASFETIISTARNLAILSWAILACASSIEEKPKPSRFPVSGLSAQTVNAAGGFTMGHYSPRHRARIGRKCSPRRCRRRPMFPGSPVGLRHSGQPCRSSSIRHMLAA
jgi:hypothetical protein